MYNGWWNLFENYGMVELYLLYKAIEKQEIEDAGDKNGGAYFEFGKFE